MEDLQNIYCKVYCANGEVGDSRIFKMNPTYNLIDHLMANLEKINASALVTKIASLDAHEYFKGMKFSLTTLMMNSRILCTHMT